MKHFIGVSLLLAAASLASADIIIQEGNIPQTDFNILFSGAGTDQTGNPVIGRSNGNPAESFLFNFDSATTLAGNGGQARVEGENDTTFTDITLSMNDPTQGFTSAIFNINAITAGNVLIAVDWISPTTNATTSDTFAININGNNPNQGQNFFTVTAANEQVISAIHLTTTDSSFQDLRQVRIGGAQALPPGDDPGDVVPEPMSISLFGGGILGVLLLRKFKTCTPMFTRNRGVGV